MGDSAELSIKLLRHMHRDQALLSMVSLFPPSVVLNKLFAHICSHQTLKTCETLLLQRTLDTDQQALIRVMTLLSAASPFVIGEQIAVLLKILTSPTASTRIQGTVLDHTYWLAERAMHRVPVTVFWVRVVAALLFYKYTSHTERQALAKHMVSHTNPLIQDKCLRIIALSALNPAYIDSALAYLYASTENVTTTTVPLDAIVEALFSISLGGRSSGLQAAQTLSVVLSHPLLSFFADSKCTILALHCQDLIKAIQERSAQSLLPAHSSRAVRRLCWALFELSPLLLKHNTLGDKLRDSVIALMKDGKLTQVLLQSILKSPRGSLFFKAHMDAFFVLSKGWDNVQWRVYLYRHALQCLPYVMGDANYEARSKTLMDLLLDLRPKTHLWHIYQLALEASHAGSWDTAATLYQTLTVELSSADLVSEPCMKWIESLSLFAEEEATLQAALSAPDSDPSVFRTDLRGLLSSLLEHPLSDEFSPRNTFQKTLLHLRKDTLQACLWLLDLHLSDADPKDLASMARSILLKLRGTGQGFTKLSRTFLDIDVSSLEAIRDWGDLIEGVVSSLIGETNVPTGQVNDDSVMDVDDSVDNTDLLDISVSSSWSFTCYLTQTANAYVTASPR